MKTIATLVVLLVMLPTPSQALELLESYVARLSVADHFNSNGDRLTKPWQIIRQDRANFHRYGIRDAVDEWDSFFGSVDNRAKAEQMLMNGFIPRDIAQDVVNGEVTVVVRIYGTGSTGTALQVTVY